MKNLQILNSKEVKHLLEKLKEQYGLEVNKKELGYAFLMNKDNRIYIITKDIANINVEELKIDAIGLYFGEQYKESIRLSIEGAQIVAKTATKGIVTISYNQMISWIKGEDIPWNIEEGDEDIGKDFIIVKYHNPKTSTTDILGCGKYNEKEKKLMNYVSKSRKLVVVND